jgi:hypothetical protein
MGGEIDRLDGYVGDSATSVVDEALTSSLFALTLNLALTSHKMGYIMTTQEACLAVIHHPFATNRVAGKAWRSTSIVD